MCLRLVNERVVFRRLLIVLLICFSYSHLSAQISLFPQGARSAGLAGIKTVESDIWSVVNNQAGLGLLSGSAIGVSHEQRFMIKEMGVSTVVASFPLLDGGLGFSLANMGLVEYGENRAGIAYGMRLGKKLSMGVGFNYHVLRFPEDYKNPYTITGEVGIIAEPIDHFTVGVHIFNPTFSVLNTEDNNDVPVILSVGLGYRVASLVDLYAELRDDVSEYFQFRFGSEFKVFDLLMIRAGVLSKPFSANMGLGYTGRFFEINFALSKHPHLGYTPQISINFTFL